MGLSDFKKWGVAEIAIIVGAAISILTYTWTVSAQVEQGKNEVIKLKENLIEFKSISDQRFDSVEKNAEKSAKGQEEIKKMIYDIDKKLDRQGNDIEWIKNKK